MAQEKRNLEINSRADTMDLMNPGHQAVAGNATAGCRMGDGQHLRQTQGGGFW